MIKYFSNIMSSILILTVLSIGITVAQNQTFDTKTIPVRRALLIGIGKYQVSEKNKSFGGLPSVSNDIKAMESLLVSDNYKFQVKKLTDEQATRENILREFENYLINDAKPGDISLLYFSGHGSQVVNSLGGETDKKDETLVPFDVVRPVKQRSDLKDIRDKEINALLNKAVEKGVIITAIIDSCHSGSIGRDGEEVRQLEPAQFDIKEKPKPEQSRDKAATNGALVLSAAQDFQRASGGPYPQFNNTGFANTATFGHLTANLLLTLYQTPADLITAEDLFKRIAARMHGDGIAQQPDIDAAPKRKRKTLFGADLDTEITRAPVASEKGKFYLLAGLADGLSTGSELVRVEVSNDKQTEVPIRIRLTKVGLSKSEFEFVPQTKDSPVVKPQNGDFFKQVTWGASTEPYLTVWMPTSNLSTDQIKQIALGLDKLRENPQIELIDEPSRNAPTHILYLEDTAGKTVWKMSFPNSEPEIFSALPTAQSVQDLLAKRKSSGKIKLFINLPPPADLSKNLNFGSANVRSSPIARRQNRQSAIYELAGRSKIDGQNVRLEYAWILPAALDETETAKAKQDKIQQPVVLPPITDWLNIEEKDSTKKLDALAMKLAKVRGWLTLNSPPEVNNIYPYRLEFRTVEGQKVDENSSLLENTEYRLFLTADPKELEDNIGNIKSEFFVYVISIDKNGNSVVLHPTGSNGQQEINAVSPPSEIDITKDDRIFICDSKDAGCEFGTENYILLITDAPFSNKDLLEFEGVRSESQRKEVGSRTGTSALENLILDIGSETKSRDAISTPDNWFVQQLTFESKRREKP